MAKYCGRCGSLLNDVTESCPICDIVKTKPQKNKKKMVIVILAIIVLVCAIIGVLFGLGLLDISSINIGSTQKSAIIYNKGNSYYINGSGNLFLLDGENVTSVKEYKDDSECKRVNWLSADNSAYDGKTIYAQCGDESENLYKYTFDEEGIIKESVWVSGEVLKNSVVTNDIGYYTRNMHYWNIDGDYVYFICTPSLEYLQSQKDIAYQLGRISIDGSNIEFIGETASAYAIKDGWIYFYDNGYVYDEGKSDKYYIDYDRVGLYKMKTDGSKKELLLNGFEQDVEDTGLYNQLCDKISIIDDYIYFIDYSENGKSRVCRIRTDGTGLEFVTENGAYSYTVDTKNNNLYYVSGRFGWSSASSRDMYKVYLETGSEQNIGEYKGSGNPEFSYADNYIYMQSYNYSVGTKVCGVRYNISSGVVENLIGIVNQDSEMVINPNTGGYEIQKSEETEEYYWEIE